MVHFCTVPQCYAVACLFSTMPRTYNKKDSLEVNSKKVLKILNWLFCVISPFPIEWIFCCREFLYHINIHFYELFLNEIKSFILNFFSSLSLSLTSVEKARKRKSESDFRRTSKWNHNQLRKEEKKFLLLKLLSSHGEKRNSHFFRVNQQTSFISAIDDHFFKDNAKILKFSFHLMRLRSLFHISLN